MFRVVLYSKALCNCLVRLTTFEFNIFEGIVWVFSEKDPEKRDQLKKLRNKTLKSIKNILQKEEEDKLNDKISEINNSKDDSRRMFKAVREIKRLSDTNIYVQDKQGNNIGNTENKIKIITEHFTSVFQNENAIPLPEYQKTTLQNPFTVEEVKKAIKSLKNNKSAGCDLLRAEHLKYAPDLLYEEIAELLNNVVETGDFPKELKIGLLVPLQKPGKKKDHRKISDQ